jgi:hypothetical protein
MAKVDLDSVEHKMGEAGVNQQEIQRVIAALKKEIEDAAALKQAQPKVVKYKYIVANTDVPAGTAIDEYPMVVVEATEDMPPNNVVDEIKNAALYANNDCNKLKKDPIRSVFDAVERLPSKYLKEKGIRVISKTATQLLSTDNKLQ